MLIIIKGFYAKTESIQKATSYDPKEVETQYYEFWEKSGYFEIDGNRAIQKSGKTFVLCFRRQMLQGVCILDTH